MGWRMEEKHAEGQIQVYELRQLHKEFRKDRMRIALEGIPAKIASGLSFLVGVGFGVLRAFQSSWIPGERMEAIISVLLPIAAGGSVFLFRWLFTAPFWAWKEIRDERDALQMKLVPKFEVACATSIPACKIETTLQLKNADTGAVYGETEATYFRAVINAHGPGQITGCTGYITRICKDGRVLLEHEKLQLQYTPGSDADTYSKTISPDIPEHLDIVFVTRHSGGVPQLIHLPVKGIPHSVNLKEIFRESGDYLITIALQGTGSRTKKFDVRFSWTGDSATSTIELITPPSPTPDKEAHRQLPIS